METAVTGKMWPSHCWTDVLSDIAVDNWINAVIAKRRLVDNGLYTDTEYKELCSFTHFFWCDYAERFQWCKKHNVIEFRGRNVLNQWFYTSPVDHILTIYGEHDINVKGYKDKKHVLELHFNNLHTWKDYKREVLDKYHLMDRNPDFIGRRDADKGINWIGDSDFFGDYMNKFILEDEPVEVLKSNGNCYSIQGYINTKAKQ
jgi:hypothetical protein